MEKGLELKSHRLKLVIFDLDGTLIDSAKDIGRSVNEVRKHLSLSPLTLKKIAGYIGGGIPKLIERALSDATAAEKRHAHRLYPTVYRHNLLGFTRPFCGVVPTLKELKRLGVTLSILTNKPLTESLMILDGLGLRHFFADVVGGDSFKKKKPDPVGAFHLLKQASSLPLNSLFVGDSFVDLETAIAASIPCCLVSYGIETRQHSSIQPDLCVTNLRELVQFAQLRNCHSFTNTEN